jgi:sec-independent protein translocase protein TatB
MSLIPQIGLFEMVLLAALALVVVGPKDLPRLMKSIGRMFRQVRGLADEFRAGLDQMAKEADLEELQKEIDELKKLNPSDELKGAVDGAMRPLVEPEQSASKTSDALPPGGKA